ncbi:hypothetical protein MUK42_32721 [Musa troglodytarum]|uniref:Uncharacterized protein n=1 Tax=Musa troglodytarum TaxID=320322 RepID=A0A9E7FW34_9LILI|nr:hypothetical protein MUK42_32721 [Musa troglodytarum]
MIRRRSIAGYHGHRIAFADSVTLILHAGASRDPGCMLWMVKKCLIDGEENETSEKADNLTRNTWQLGTMEIVEPALMPYFVDYGDLVVVGCRDEHSSVHVHQVLHVDLVAPTLNEAGVGQVLFVTKIQRQRAEWTSQLRILLEAPDQGSYLVILADARPLFSGIRVLIWHN